MVGGGAGADDDGSDAEPVSAQDVAAYIHEIAAGMAVAARDVGLDDVADALERAEARAKAALKKPNGHPPSKKKRRD